MFQYNLLNYFILNVQFFFLFHVTGLPSSGLFFFVYRLLNSKKGNLKHCLSTSVVMPLPFNTNVSHVLCTLQILTRLCIHVKSIFLNSFGVSVDGNWSLWGPWGECSVTCGGGTQTRSRSCTNPPMAHGGKPCTGPSEMARDCNIYIMCPGKLYQ